METLHQAFQSLANRDVLQIAREAANGAQLHLVGGALRDRYLELASPDLDLVVAGNGHDFSARLASRLQARLVLLGGNRFAAYRLVRQDFVIDIWDRQEASLYSDLERRDFTINAIAFDVDKGTIHDPFHGLQDLDGRLLRVVTEASLHSDPLRALRLVRFALLLPGFSIDPHTQDLARSAAAQLSAVATERIREELARILQHGKPTQSFDLLCRFGLAQSLWGCGEIKSPNNEDLASTLVAYEAAEAICPPLAGRVPNRLLCVHALISRALSTAGSTSNASQLVTRSQVRAIALLSTVDPNQLGADPRSFLARWGASWLEAATLTASLSTLPEESFTSWLEQLVALVETEGENVLDPQPLLNGQEIQDLLDLPPGPAIGNLLKKLLDAQLRGKVKGHSEAKQFVAKQHANNADD